MTGRRSRAGTFPLALPLAFALVLVAAVARPAAGLEIALEASRSRVAVGEQFTVSVQVSHAGMGNVPEPELPPVDHIRQISSYSSRNFSYVNGRATSSLTMQFVMVADEPGTYTLGPARATKDGQTIASGTASVEVGPARSSASAGPPGGSGEGDGDGAEEVGDSAGDDLLVFARVDDDTPFVNEQVTYSFTFLRRVRLLDTPKYGPPDVTGFWAEDLDTMGPTEVTKDGRRYYAERVRTALFPTGPGEYTIGESYLTATVEDRTRRGRRDPFDIFGSDRFGLFRSGRDLVLRTEPIPIRVRPLPAEGKPDGFSGAVGQFALTATADRTALAAGDPVTLRIVLEGTGNVKVIPPPDLGTLEGFKLYQSETAESTWVADDRVMGRKTWEYVLVPTGGGDLEIPPIEVDAFDPEREGYVVHRTDPIPLEVEATPLDEALARGEDVGLAKERVRLRQRDIRWVKPVPDRLRAADGAPWTSTGFLLAHALPLLAFAGAVWTRRHRERLRSDVRWARARAAAKAASRRLREAKARLDAGDLETFFGELSQALRGYVADKLHLAAANLDPDRVREGLASAGAPDAEADELFGMLESCDSARFSPLGGDRVAAAELLQRASEWIQRGEKR